LLQSIVRIGATGSVFTAMTTGFHSDAGVVTSFRLSEKVKRTRIGHQNANVEILGIVRLI